MKVSGGDAVKLFSGPAGYALVVVAAIAGIVILWNKFSSQQGPPGSLGASVGNNTGQAVGSVITGLGDAIQKPFNDWLDSGQATPGVTGAAPNAGDAGDPGTFSPGGG